MKVIEEAKTPACAAKLPPKSIISMVDFSRGSLQGAKLAAGLARRWGCPLELVHVVEDIPPALSENADSATERARRRRYYRSLESRLRSAADCRRLAKVAVIDGEPKEVLSTLAGERSDDLIVTGGASDALEDRLFGSVGRAIIDAARVPVLTVRDRQARRWPGSILVPMGMEDLYDGALVYAMGLAHGLDATVSVVHIAPGDDYRLAAGDAFQARLRRLGLERDRRLREHLACGGPARECLLERTRAGDIGIIVLAACRAEPWQRPSFEPWGEAILERCRIPVLTVPTGKVWAVESLLGEERRGHVLAR